jgi:phage RecT family recombinase
MIAISESWKLQACLKTDVGQNSMYNSLKLAAITGLSLNPLEGEAALVPRQDDKGNWTCSYQKMKNGLIRIALEDTDVARIKADLVRENDEFEITSTANGDEYKFKPARKERGEIDGYFAAVTLEDGSVFTKYMTREEVLDHREKYSPFYKDKKSGKENKGAAWVKSFDGMAIKTVLKAVLNGLNLQSVTRKALIADDQILTIDGPSMFEKPDTGAETVIKKMDVPSSEENENENQNEEQPDDIV